MGYKTGSKKARKARQKKYSQGKPVEIVLEGRELVTRLCEAELPLRELRKELAKKHKMLGHRE